MCLCMSTSAVQPVCMLYWFWQLNMQSNVFVCVCKWIKVADPFSTPLCNCSQSSVGYFGKHFAFPMKRVDWTMRCTHTLTRSHAHTDRRSSTCVRINRTRIRKRSYKWTSTMAFVSAPLADCSWKWNGSSRNKANEIIKCWITWFRKYWRLRFV